MDLLDLIGNTPLVDLDYFSPLPDRVHLYAKAEWTNPGGSLKDRPVKAMLTHAVQCGDLTKDKIVLDSSSGNAGISYGMIAGALGYRAQIVIPGNASSERKKRLMSHGADLILTDPLEGYDEAMRHVREIYQERPDKYFFCDQYTNRQNVLSHYHGTGVEILEQAPRPVTHFVCGVGTGGSITGIGQRLKEYNHNIRVVGVRPQRWPGIEGLKPLGEEGDIVPQILREELIDEWIDVSSDEAKICCHQLAKKGIFVGQSSGAYIAGCQKLMKNLTTAVIVTLLCDLGERYFSAGLWDTRSPSS